MPIDLDDLEIALTSSDGPPRYLDLRTGVSRTAATSWSVEAWELSPDETEEGSLKRYLVRVLISRACVRRSRSRDAAAARFIASSAS